MTRKCALCKESNYKNVYSFFSAPKDPAMRKNWEEALSMDVTDDTFVCSKHFHQEDIVTHWVSGQPPHVITIKYKKCRLKPHAVPILGVEFENNIQNNMDEEADSFEYKVNRNNSSFQSKNNKGEDRTGSRYELSYSQGRKKCRVKEEKVSSDQVNNMIVTNETEYVETVHTLESYINQEQVETEKQTFSIPRESVNVLEQEESSDYDVDVRDYILRTEQKKRNLLQSNDIQSEDDGHNVKKKMRVHETKFLTNTDKIDSNDIVEDHIYLSSEDVHITQEEQTVEIWETNDADNIKREDQQIIQTVTVENCQTESMLFEDLLEICTEVSLPSGWSTNVIPKGHETTVVYSFTSTTNSSIPFIEKQIYLKSDMILHFGTSNIEIDPFEYNLIKNGRDLQIHALTDIEDVIEEFDQRRVCEGINETAFEENKNLSLVAMREGSKWRHTECSILINNDESICPKCNTLIDFDDDIINNQQTTVNQPSDMDNDTNSDTFENVTEFELSPSSNKNNLITAIDDLNIPEVQKIMMKECLKTSTELDGQKSIKFSKTWIFLCVLLYIESPRMYRYMLLNDYLCLPPLFTIQRYLHRIKTEPRFYKYFQRSIKPFQPKEKGNSEIKVEAT